MATNITTITGAANLPSYFGKFIPSRGTLIFGALLALFQAIDGILTTIGIDRFGPSIEGNPLLRNLIMEFGHVPILTLIKTTAVMVVAFMTIVAARLPWVKGAIGALTCLYFFSAIVPWTYILFIKPIG